jgi:nicotinamidase-related amidase
MILLQPVMKSIILCEIEAHTCIHYTPLDLRDMGLDVYIPGDCVSNRPMIEEGR